MGADQVIQAPLPVPSQLPMRLLGQYAAVGILTGQAAFESPACAPQLVMPGEVILLFPETPARYYPSPDWSTCWVVWNGPESDRIASEAGLTPSNPVVSAGAATVNRACAELAAWMTDEDLGAILERKRILLGLLAELIRTRDRRTPGLQQRMVKAIRLIEADPDHPPTVQALAAAAHLSASQFGRLFQRHAGRTPAAFITAQRMSRAQTLLASGLSIKETATMTGYADVFHFMRVFRKTVGTTAGRFARASAMPPRAVLPPQRG